jgi:hypothetical protein
MSGIEVGDGRVDSSNRSLVMIDMRVVKWIVLVGLAPDP